MASPEPRPSPALQTPVHESIARELIALAPAQWSTIVLSLNRKPYPPEAGEAGEGVAHSVNSPDGERDVVCPSEDLFVHTRALELLFQDHGVPWRSAEYRVSRESDGAWKWAVSFSYDQPTPR